MIEIKIINKLFIVKTLLEKTWNKMIFKEFSLTVSLYRLLKVIDKWLSEIHEIQKISDETKSSLTQKIKKLEDSWFIVRNINKKDKRRWYFYITQKWTKTIKKVEEKYLETSKELFSEFSKKQKKSFFEQLLILEEELQKKESKIIF